MKHWRSWATIFIAAFAVGFCSACGPTATRETTTTTEYGTVPPPAPVVTPPPSSSSSSHGSTTAPSGASSSSQRRNAAWDRPPRAGGRPCTSASGARARPFRPPHARRRPGGPGCGRPRARSRALPTPPPAVYGRPPASQAVGGEAALSEHRVDPPVRELAPSDGGGVLGLRGGALAQALEQVGRDLAGHDDDAVLVAHDDVAGVHHDAAGSRSGS